MTRLYITMCVLGTAVPLFVLGRFAADEGFDPQAFWDQATSSKIAVFAWVDVILTGITLIVVAARERIWAAVAGTVLVGPSLGLPLYLLLRER